MVGGRSERRRAATRRRARDQALPALAVAPDGRVDVVYYDGRADPGGPATEVAWQTSTDGAATFAARQTVSTRPFDSTIGYRSEQGLAQLGDRLGLAATTGGALAVWADTRTDEAATGKQDLASALIAVTTPTPTPPTWLLAVAGLGVLILAGAAVVRHRRHTSAAAADTALVAPADAGPPIRAHASAAGEADGDRPSQPSDVQARLTGEPNIPLLGAHSKNA